MALRNDTNRTACSVYTTWSMTTEKYKILLREIRDLNKWTGIPCEWMRRCSNVMLDLPISKKVFNGITTNIPIFDSQIYTGKQMTWQIAKTIWENNLGLYYLTSRFSIRLSSQDNVVLAKEQRITSM